MPFGYAPFTRDPLDQLVDRRLKQREETMLALGPTDAAVIAPEYLVEPAPEPTKQSYLAGLASRLLSPEGLTAIGTGIAASASPQGKGRGLERFGRGLASSGAVLEERRKTKSAEDIARARTENISPRQTRSEQLQGEIEVLTKLGLSPEELKNRYARPGAEQTGERLESTEEFLRSIGVSDDDIQKYFLSRGVGGRGGGTGRLTDREMLAQSLVAQGKAANMDEARVMAVTFGRQPRVAGYITRRIADPKDPFSFTTRQLNVFQKLNETTGNYDLIDENGDIVTQEDLLTFRGSPIDFQGGTGGKAVSGGSAPPEEPVPPPPLGTVPSHAVTPGLEPQAAAPQSDLDARVIPLLSDPRTKPEVLMLYASGRGPLGDSPQIRAAAAQRLRGGQ